MKNKTIYKFLAVIAALSLSFAFGAAPYVTASHTPESKGVIDFEGSHDSLWILQASKPLIIGGYGDNFNYDGSRVKALKGDATVSLDADKDVGSTVVNIKGSITPEKGKTLKGDIRIVFRIVRGGPAFKEGGVADFVYLHGDTAQGPPVMPKTRAFLASWTRADVFVNGELVYKDLDGHVMYTERTLDPKKGVIYSSDRSGFYSNKKPTDYSIFDPDSREVHFVAHSEVKDMNNYPPHTVWIHLNFTEVKDLTARK